MSPAVAIAENYTNHISPIMETVLFDDGDVHAKLKETINNPENIQLLKVASNAVKSYLYDLYTKEASPDELEILKKLFDQDLPKVESFVLLMSENSHVDHLALQTTPEAKKFYHYFNELLSNFQHVIAYIIVSIQAAFAMKNADKLVQYTAEELKMLICADATV